MLRYKSNIPVCSAADNVKQMYILSSAWKMLRERPASDGEWQKHLPDKTGMYTFSPVSRTQHHAQKYLQELLA